MATILVLGLHVYLMEKLIKILEDNHHFVIGVFAMDMVRYNLRSRHFDYILLSPGLSSNIITEVEEAVEKYQEDCIIEEAIYDPEKILSLVK